MSRPQPFGLLPTWWFWRELRDERPLVGVLIGAFVGAFVAAISWALVTTGVYLPVALLVALCAPMIGLGLVERALRWAVHHRRHQLAEGGWPTSAPGPTASSDAATQQTQSTMMPARAISTPSPTPAAAEVGDPEHDAGTASCPPNEVPTLPRNPRFPS